MQIYADTLKLIIPRRRIYESGNLLSNVDKRLQINFYVLLARKTSGRRQGASRSGQKRHRSAGVRRFSLAPHRCFFRFGGTGRRSCRHLSQRRRARCRNEADAGIKTGAANVRKQFKASVPAGRTALLFRLLRILRQPLSYLSSVSVERPAWQKCRGEFCVG